MSDSVRPHRWQPTRLLHPWDSPGKNTGVGCHFLLQCMKVRSESEVAQSWTAAYQVPPSMAFSRQEYWSGVPSPSLVCALSHVQFFATLWTIVCQAPLSVGFSRQDYWSGLPCPPPGDLPNPVVEPTSLISLALAGGLFIFIFFYH